MSGPIPRYQQITDADLVPVSVPAGRPADFQVVTDKAALVGQYAADNLMPGTLLAPGMTIAEPPAQRTFSTGKDLPVGMRAYPLTIASDLAPVLREDDLVDLVIVDPGNGTALWLLSSVQPLAIVTPKDGNTATYILALTPEQVSVVEGALADARVSQGQAYAKLVLSQTKNTPLDPQTEYRYREIKLPAATPAAP